MISVSHATNDAVSRWMEITMLQARLAKDGSDDDLKWATSDEEIERDKKYRKIDVYNRTERIKYLLRLGLTVEAGQVLNDNDTYVFDGHDLALAGSVIIAKIGTRTTVI